MNVIRSSRVAGLTALLALAGLSPSVRAEELVFKPGDVGDYYLYCPMNETSKRGWWVGNRCLDDAVGSDVTLWGEQDKSVYSNYFKRATSNWAKNVGTVKGDNTWLWEFRQPSTSAGSMSIGDARDFFGWWRFLRPTDVSFPLAAADNTPVVQRLESVGRVNLTVPAAAGRVVVSNLFGSGVVQKSGPGELEVVRTGGAYVNIAHHAGTLVLHEQEKGASTTFESVLARAKVHFDASDKTKFVFDDQDKVTRWNASEPNAQYYAQPVTTNKYSGMGAPMFTYKYGREVLPKPVYRDNYSATGLGVVDFGPFRKYDAADADTCGASALEFMRSGARVNYVEAFIVFADNDPQCRCDVFCDSHNQTFQRATDNKTFDNDKNVINFNGGILATYRYSTRVSRDIRVNGRLVPPSFPLAGKNLKVVSIDCRKVGNVQSSESVMGAFARRNNSEFGGQVVAEFIGFAVSLTDAERQAVNRHLMEKWLGRSDCDAADVNMVEADAGTTIAVPDGETATVNHLLATTNGMTVVKTGDGTLGMVDVGAYGGKEVDIDVQGGAVAFKAPAEAMSAAPQIAASPRYHFDASKLDSLTTNRVGSTTYVTKWDDVSQAGVYAYAATDEFTLKATTNTPPEATQPDKPQLEMNKCNGLPVVYFGSRIDPNTIKKTGFGNSAAMLYTQGTDDDPTTLANVFEGFAVIAGGYCVYPFSSTKLQMFYPDGYHLISSRYGMAALKSGVWTVDGDPVDPATFDTTSHRGRNLNGQFYVLRFSSNERVHVNGIAFQDGTPNGIGGLRVGEVVLYDRRLNETERRNTEAALMRKWLGKTHPLAAGPQVKSLNLAATSKATVETDVDLYVSDLKSARATFTKGGSGKLTAALPAAVKDLTVASGSYAILPASNVMSRALLHLDANEPDSLEHDFDGEDWTKIVRWRDVRGADYPCAQTNASRYLDCPTLKAEAQNGLSVVDFGDTTTYGKAGGGKDVFQNYPNSGKALCFDRTLLVREGFVVLKHDTYAPILGGMDYTSFYPNNDTLINVNPTTDHSLSCLKRQAEWRIDDDEIDIWTYTWATYKATGTGYHVISFAITNDYTTVQKQVNCAAVQNLCADRAYDAGGQKYGEVVLFDCSLTPDERQTVREHLIRKWNTAESGRTLDSLTLGAGASLSLGPVTSVKRLTSDGTVTGDLALSEAAEIRANYRSADDYTQTVVSGTLTLPTLANVTLTVDAVTKPSRSSSVDLFVADAIVGTCAGWTEVAVKTPGGDKYRSRSVRLSVVTRSDGKQALRATFYGHGFAIIYR